MTKARNLPNINAILLLGTNNILALPVIRSIAAVMPKVEIHTLSYRNRQQVISDLSRYVHTRHFLEPSYEEGELAPVLRQKIEETDADILLPIDEDDVRKLSKLRSQLKEFVHLPPLPDTTLFDTLVHKNQLVSLLKSQGVPHPNTYVLKDIDYHEIKPDFFPGLLKPTRGSAGQGIKKVDNIYQLRHHLERNDSKEYILQEIIPGKKLICNLLAEEGTIHSLNIQEGIESRDYSFSTAIRFIKNPQVSELVHRLIRQTRYSGLANIDFLLDERDGQAKLVDFNPRFWSSLSGSKAAGVDFTWLVCMTAMGSFNSSEELITQYGMTYHMGRSTFRYWKRRLNPFSESPTNNGEIVNTDFRERIMDPLPEIMRLLQ